MLIILVLLCLPAMGAAMLLADWQRREGMDADARGFALWGLLGLGLLTFPLAGGLVWSMVAMAMSTSPVPMVTSSSIGDLIVLCWSVFISGLLTWVLLNAGIKAVRIGRQAEGQELTVRTRATIHEDAVSLRFYAICLCGFPLLFPAMIGAVVVGPFLYFSQSYSQVRISRYRQFLWVLATTVKTKLPLADEVEAFAESLPWHAGADHFDLARDLRQGTPLSASLLARPHLCAPDDALTIKLGEETGRVAQVLSQNARQESRVVMLAPQQSSFSAVFFYSWTVTLLTILLVSFLMYWIIPKFKDIFNDFGAELPSLTRILIESSDVFVSYWYIMIWPIMGLPSLVLILMMHSSWVGQQTAGRSRLSTQIHALMSKLISLVIHPVRREAPQMLRWLAIATDCQLPLPAALTSLSTDHPDPDTAMRIERVGQRLQDSGQQLGEALMSEKYIYSVEAAAIEAGQRAGGLSFVLRGLADRMDRVRSYRDQFWCQLAGPIVTCLIGCLIAFVVIAMFMPLVHLLNQLSLEQI